MTSPNLQDSHVLLILGEVRGDVKGIVNTLRTLEANINAVEATSEARFIKIEGEAKGLAARVSTLEGIKTRVGYLAAGVGLASGLTAPKIFQLLATTFGG